MKNIGYVKLSKPKCSTEDQQLIGKEPKSTLLCPQIQAIPLQTKKKGIDFRDAQIQ